MKPIYNLRTFVVLCLFSISTSFSLFGNTLNFVDTITIKPTEKIGLVNLDLSIDSDHSVTVHILDMYEQKYFENFLEKKYGTGVHNEVLDLTELPSGLYTIQVICGEQEINQKLIVMSEM